jgi:hypothetical protein
MMELLLGEEQHHLGVPAEAGFMERVKRAFRRLEKHLNGESECKHNCQGTPDYGKCFNACMMAGRTDSSFTVPIVQVKM